MLDILLAGQLVIVHGAVARLLIYNHRVGLLFRRLGEELGPQDFVFSIQSLLFIPNPCQVLRHLIDLLLGLLLVHLRSKLGVLAANHLVLALHHLTCE